MYHLEDIFKFLEQYSCPELHAETDLFQDCGIAGEDWDELIEDYSKTFNVDMSGYLWYFHSEDEAAFNNPGTLFFKPPYERVTRIPITPAMLLDFARKNKWDINYPPHKLPKYRWDIIITWLISLIFLFIIIRSCLS